MICFWMRSSLELGRRRNEFEGAVRDDDAVPGGRGGAGEKALALVLDEIRVVGDENPGVRIELQEFPACLGEAMARNHHHRLGDQSEPFLLHDRGGDAEGLAGSYGVGDIGRSRR